MDLTGEMKVKGQCGNADCEAFTDRSGTMVTLMTAFVCDNTHILRVLACLTWFWTHPH